jgi:hypothetical protein
MMTFFETLGRWKADRNDTSSFHDGKTRLVDEVDAEEMKNQTSKHIVRECPVDFGFC